MFTRTDRTALDVVRRIKGENLKGRRKRRDGERKRELSLPERGRSELAKEREREEGDLRVGDRERARCPNK